ncbi:MAG: hypothetical protein H6842_12855 [Rhodospirillaceae bacterium]|nr:hypothetical protein [Rhodospirillaceae bacterium]
MRRKRPPVGLRAAAAAVAVVACTGGGGTIAGHWAEAGACQGERWYFRDGEVFLTYPGSVRGGFATTPGEIRTRWGIYEPQDDGSVLLRRSAPAGREIVLKWVPQDDGSVSMEMYEPGGVRRNAVGQRC